MTGGGAGNLLILFALIYLLFPVFIVLTLRNLKVFALLEKHKRVPVYVLLFIFLLILEICVSTATIFNFDIFCAVSAILIFIIYPTSFYVKRYLR